MSESETPEFMSVDSFSQLPFIRPAPPSRKKNSSSSTTAGVAIRLFGIDFTHEPDTAEDDQPSSKAITSTGSNDNGSGGGGGGGRETGGSGTDSSRRFECHYCCRNFPTSQALGGHQNAHKRERQHAKRVHLQSAMAAAHHRILGGVTEGHVYGLLDYHRLDPMPSAGRFGIGHAFEPPPLQSYYPSWNSAIPAGGLVGSRFYSGYGPVSRSIDGGDPLPGTWRNPVVQVGSRLPPPQNDQPAVLPLLGGDESGGTGDMRGDDNGGGGILTDSPSSSSSPPEKMVYEAAAGVQDHLSLDLHL